MRAHRTSRFDLNSITTLFFTFAFALVFAISTLLPSSALAQKKTTRKTQEVNFAEMSLKGTVRNPEGAFLVQKRGIRFMPLYEVQKDVDKQIRNSTEHVR